MTDIVEGFSVLRADWDSYHRQIMLIRRSVFVDEQGVSESEEVDSMDPLCRFVLAIDIDDNPVGTARLLPNGRIGRMAVLKSYRGLGLGSLVLRELLNMAKENGIKNLFLHAQINAIPFYEKHGFIAEGPVFEEARILHQQMSYNRKY